MARLPKTVIEVLRTVLAPLIEADGGRLYLVSADERLVRLHLAGTCSGCPGSEATTQHVIEPAIAAVAPTAEVQVTNGWLVPDGAELIEPGEI